MTKKPPLRVMLVDDHEIVRDGIRAMLATQEDVVVTAEAGTVREAVDEAERTRPDVVVIISDLAGLAEDEARAKRAIARLRKAAGSVVALVPSPSAFLPQGTTPHGRLVRELMVRDQRTALDPGRRLLARRHAPFGPSGSRGTARAQIGHEDGDRGD